MMIVKIWQSRLDGQIHLYETQIIVAPELIEANTLKLKHDSKQETEKTETTWAS